MSIFIAWMWQVHNPPCRNNFLTEKGLPLPKATSTGTTIVGCLFKDGLVLGADTRATEGPIVADKNCEKVRSSIPWRLLILTSSSRYTTSRNPSAAVVQELPLIQNSLPLSSPRTWRCMLCKQDENRALSLQ